MPKLYLIRGISGSGKSFLAQEIGLDRGVYTFEADDWFKINPQGKYIFQPEELHNAHTFCRLSAESELRYGCDTLVSNTFTTIKELQPYADLAVKYNATVVLMEPTTEWWINRNVDELVKRNVNGVPREIIERQIARWVPLPVGSYTAAEFKEILNDAVNHPEPRS